jgi:hypothetical protein
VLFIRELVVELLKDGSDSADDIIVDYGSP